MTTPFALSIIGGMSERRRSISTSGPNIWPAVMRGNRATQILEGRFHGLDRRTHLLDDVVGDHAPVGADPGSSRDTHDLAVPDGAREPELELASAPRRVHVTLRVGRILGRHQLRILLMTASANSLV